MYVCSSGTQPACCPCREDQVLKYKAEMLNKDAQNNSLKEKVRTDFGV